MYSCKKQIMMRYIVLLSLIIAFTGCNVPTGNAPEVKAKESFKQYAPTPPMGWNSFDAYDSRINEAEFRACVDYISENLKEYGWEYVTLDYIWWHPKPGHFKSERRHGHPNIRYVSQGEPLHPEHIAMDEYGRLLPSVERFPSAADGAGLKPLVDYVHSKGLKFGLHIMRGIHRYAWFKDTPIAGTTFSARDIAEPFDTCSWCNHMYGVDKGQPGAQEYYNSLMNLYAEWGVDFIKADDMMVPKYHKGEIEMIRNAIDQCGRPMVLSLSCGDAPISFAKHLAENANMWRISSDFWDKWSSLFRNFDLLHAWSPFIAEGQFPDADMLPIGKLSLDNRPHGPERMTQFTKDEQYTLMNLWCISRSPLILGADPLSMDSFTLSLLTNNEVIAVNQNSSGNRQIDFGFGDALYRIWFADIPGSDEKYFALFNISDNPEEITFDFEFEELRESYIVRDLWLKADLGTFSGSFTRTLPPHGSALYKLSPVKK